MIFKDFNPRNYFFFLSLLFLLGCNGPVQYNHTATLSNTVDLIMQDHGIPGMAVCVFDNDSVYYYYYSGIKRLGYPNTISKDDLWHLGSNTKSFIAFAACSMVEDGLISYDMRFFDLFPEYTAISLTDYRDVNLNQLLRHRAGLPANTRAFPELLTKLINRDTALERKTLYEWALQQARYGGGYQYSNIGYVMIADMLEKVTGKNWKHILQERIFNPLEMHPHYGWPAQKDTNEIWGHLVDPETKVFMAHSPEDEYTLSRMSFGPAGGLCLSIPDFVKFLQDNLNGWNGRGGLLGKQTYQLMHSGKDYGLGWGIVDEINSTFHNVSVHSGSAGTFYSKALLFKKENLGIIICMNRYVENNNDFIYPLVNKILMLYR